MFPNCALLPGMPPVKGKACCFVSECGVAMRGKDTSGCRGRCGSGRWALGLFGTSAVVLVLQAIVKEQKGKRKKQLHTLDLRFQTLVCTME